jgi:uncharacterized protein
VDIADPQHGGRFRGPVLAQACGRAETLPKEQFVATGAWFFLVINLAKVPIYSWHHLFSAASLGFDFVIVPAVICGALAGLWIVHAVPQLVFDTMIFLLTGISAVVLFR